MAALEGVSAEKRGEMLNKLLEVEVIRQKAAEMGLAPSKAELEKRWTTEVFRFGGEAGLAAYLERTGLDEAAMKKRLTEELTRTKVQAALRATPAVVDDAQVKAYYDEHPEEFLIPEQLRLRHILIEIPKGASQRVNDEAIAKLRVMKARVLAGKADFEKLAGEHTAKGQTGGDLGWLARRQIDPAVATAAWSLKDGQVSDPVRSPYGYHLVQRVETRAEQLRAFDLVKDAIRNVLVGQATERKAAETLEAWIRAPEVEVFVDVGAAPAEPKPHAQKLPQPIKGAPARPIRPHPGDRTGPPKM